MKYHIITYGCQMNMSDSERIAAILKLAKITSAKNMKEADLLIINSCSVRQSAIDRIYGQLINFKKLNNCGKTILTGCVLGADKKNLENKFDLIIDIKELTNPKTGAIKKLLKLIIAGRRTAKQEFKAFNYTDYFKINPQYRSAFSAYVPIMTGCNNFCSYCAVPYTRGQEFSRPAQNIINEVKKLVKKGYKEITLLGQNINNYKSKIQISIRRLADETNSKLKISNPKQAQNAKDKRQNATEINFPQLLKLINDIPGNFWIRFLTSHPKDMSSELIKTMAKCEKVCEYVHLPIQSGDDKILQKMNRRYTGDYYLKLIKKIKKAYNLEALPPSTLGGKASKLPIAISTDIIVGFPRETKKQFLNTAKIMRKVKYDMAYLAQYSPRPGTAAAKLEDNVPIAEKKRRKEFLNDILRITALANNKKYIGKIVEVLIENPPAGGDNNFAYGKTRTFKNVRIPMNCPYKKSKQRSKIMPTANPPKTNHSELPAINAELPRPITTRLATAKLKPGQFAAIKITQASAWGLEGEIA